MTKENNIYFDDEIENLVVEYRDPSTSKRQKNKIYTDHLYPIFHKMVKVLIHKQKIYYTGEDLESLVSETEIHVWDKLNNSDYDPDKGRAYSYFTRTILNYLYQKQKANQKLINDYGLDSINDDENYYIETFYEEEEDFDLAELLEFFKEWLNKNVDDLFDPEEEYEELQIIHAINNILNSNDAGIEKPKHFFFAIKQQTGIDNNYRINIVLNILKDKYFKMKKEYSKEFTVEVDE